MDFGSYKWYKRWCASEDTGPKGDGLLDPTSVGEENETFFIRVWKPLPSRQGKSEEESSNKTISVSGGLGLLHLMFLGRVIDDSFC